MRTLNRLFCICINGNFCFWAMYAPHPRAVCPLPWYSSTSPLARPRLAVLETTEQMWGLSLGTCALTFRERVSEICHFQVFPDLFPVGRRAAHGARPAPALPPFLPPGAEDALQAVPPLLRGPTKTWSRIAHGGFSQEEEGDCHDTKNRCSRTNATCARGRPEQSRD